MNGSIKKFLSSRTHPPESFHGVGRAQILAPFRQPFGNEVRQLGLESGCEKDHFEVGDAPDSALDLRDGFPSDIKTDEIAAGGKILLREVLERAEFPHLCADGVA